MTLSLTSFDFRSVQPVAFSAWTDVHRSRVDENDDVDADDFASAATACICLCLFGIRFAICHLLFTIFGFLLQITNFLSFSVYAAFLVFGRWRTSKTGKGWWACRYANAMVPLFSLKLDRIQADPSRPEPTRADPSRPKARGFWNTYGTITPYRRMCIRKCLRIEDGEGAGRQTPQLMSWCGSYHYDLFTFISSHLGLPQHPLGHATVAVMNSMQCTSM